MQLESKDLRMFLAISIRMRKGNATVAPDKGKTIQLKEEPGTEIVPERPIRLRKAS